LLTDIQSKDNPVIKKAHKLLTSSNERKNTKTFLIEGQRLCCDALESSMKIEALFFTKSAQERYGDSIECLSSVAEKSYRLTDEVFEKISDTLHPQGISCICSMPHFECDEIKHDGRYIALENISDPTNMGTILRTAEAFGFDGVIISAGSCDIYNPKVLRGSMGAVFRIPVIIPENLPELLQKCKSRGMRPMASITDGNAVSIVSVRFFRGVIMCIGNEGNGLSEETITACGERVTIPMAGGAEALNASVAASILMWEMSRGK